MTWESSENPLILGACHCPLFTVGPTAAWPLMTNGSLMKVEVLQNAPLGAFCNTFDLH